MKPIPQYFRLPGLLSWQIYLLFWVCGSFFPLYPLPAALCALLFFLGFKKVRTWPRLALAFALFCASALFIQQELRKAGPEQSLPQWAAEGSPFKGHFCGEINQVQALPGRRVRLLLKDVHPETGSGTSPLPLLCSLTKEEKNPFFSPKPGQNVCFRGTIRQARPALNMDSDLANPLWKSRKLLWQSFSGPKSGAFEITGEGELLSAVRERLRASFLLSLGFKEYGSLPDRIWKSHELQARAILLALCFGDRRLLSPESSENFASAAIAHSLALSGQHLGVTALIAIFAVFLISRLNPGIHLRIPRLQLAIILALPLALLYLWIGNAPPSLLRAAGMLFLICLFILRKTAFSGLDLVCGTALFLLLLNPLLIFDLGFQLSLLCVLLIVLFAPAINTASRLIPELPLPFQSALLKRCLEILLISLLIQLFLLPLNVMNFSLTGFCFPLNLIWLPVLGFFVLPLAFLALMVSLIPGAIPQMLAGYVAKLAALPCEWLLTFLDSLRSLNLLEDNAWLVPHWLYLPAFAILAASIAWLLAHKDNVDVRKKCALFLITAMFFMALPPAMRLSGRFHHPLALEALDVGQGLSILLELPGNLRILYDGGGSAKGNFDPGKRIVAPHLAANNVPKLSAIINSHPDVDHLGGLLYLLRSFQVGKLFHNGDGQSASGGAEWAQMRQAPNAQVLLAGDIIHLDKEKNGLRLEILHPPASKLPGSDGSRFPDPKWRGNHASLVMRLCKGDEGLILLTGDAEKDTLRYILKSGQNIQARLLVAPHHGSDRSLVKEFYRKVQPELVLAACGHQNRWAYPGKKLRSFLKQLDVKLLDTGSSGKIRVEFGDKGKMAIQTMREKRPGVLESLEDKISSCFSSIFDSWDKKRLTCL